MTPTKRILDPDFEYVPSFDTNIRETFARVRREQAEAEAKRRAGFMPPELAAVTRIGPAP